MRRVAVDFEKAHQTVDQVVNGRRKIRTVVSPAPLIQKETVALVFFQRGGIEYAQHLVVDPNRFHLVDRLSRRSPVEGVNVLQNGENICAGHEAMQLAGQVTRSEV